MDDTERNTPDGMMMVPIVPTPEMLSAARESAWAEDAAAVWQDMIEAWTEQSASDSDTRPKDGDADA